jgi:hypothetical protein
MVLYRLSLRCFEKRASWVTINIEYRHELILSINLGYFKGNGTNVIRIVPYSAVQFASYEQYKKVILQLGGYQSTYIPPYSF